MSIVSLKLLSQRILNIFPGRNYYEIHRYDINFDQMNGLISWYMYQYLIPNERLQNLSLKRFMSLIREDHYVIINSISSKNYTTIEQICTRFANDKQSLHRSCIGTLAKMHRVAWLLLQFTLFNLCL